MPRDRWTCPKCGWRHPAASMVARHIEQERCGDEPDNDKEHR